MRGLPFEKNSLFYQTFLSILGASLLFTIVASIGLTYWTYQRARDEQDDRLEATAMVLARQALAQQNPTLWALNEDTFEEKVLENFNKKQSFPANRVLDVQILSRAGQVRELVYPFALSAGEQTVFFGDIPYRMSLIFFTEKDYYAVAEPLREINEKVLEQTLQATLPLISLIPVLLLVVGGCLWWNIRPLKRFSQEICARDIAILNTPLSTHDLPREMHPVIQAFNTLLQKIDNVHQREKRFTADAAHELRSPLTALQLEIELLQKQNFNPRTQVALDRIHQGLHRCIRQVSQLLTLARAQAHTPSPREQKPWFFSRIYADLFEELYTQARRKSLVIEMQGLENEQRQTSLQRRAQRTILRNLLENAIHYTPAHGHVTILHDETDQWLQIRIIDTGVGIADQDKKRVFDPFFRVLGNKTTGTGLGLAIVRRLVEQRKGKIELTDHQPQGLCVTLRYKK